jgi:hypothetical protein
MRWREAARRSGRGVGLGLGAAFLVVLGTSPAGADCSGPMIEYDAGPVDRGQAISVSGGGFGDNCYDTGPPPAGEGILGRPLTDVEVVITQAGVDHLVAEGNADDEYEFTVEVVVPADLAPGEARLQVRWGPGTTWAVDQTDQPLVVSDAAATSGGDEVATFGPDGEGEATAGESGTGEAASAEAGEVDDDGSGGWSEPGRWIVAAVVLAAIVGVGSMVLVRQR